MDQLELQIRTASRDRKAKIGVHPETRLGDILAEARANWAMPDNYDYILRSERLGQQLDLNSTLQAAGVQDGDTLEVQQLSDAGVWRGDLKW
jgi:hypothetical protein